jgi:hypothetical protein
VRASTSRRRRKLSVGEVVGDGHADRVVDRPIFERYARGIGQQSKARGAFRAEAPKLDGVTVEPDVGRAGGQEFCEAGAGSDVEHTRAVGLGEVRS